MEQNQHNAPFTPKQSHGLDDQTGGSGPATRHVGHALPGPGLGEGGPRPLHGGVTLPDYYRHEPNAPLPMVVWLRGDEDLMDEFTVDAEGAMAFLGIKRTRLTQISGRELRVARVRIDRYVRPMYRAEDLESYRAWTRAPATHQSAAGTIRDAAKEWEDVAAGLLAKWAEGPPATGVANSATASPEGTGAPRHFGVDAETLRIALSGLEMRLRQARHDDALWREDATRSLWTALTSQADVLTEIAQRQKHGELVAEAAYMDLQTVLEKTTAWEARGERLAEELKSLGKRQDQLAQLVMHTWQKWQEGLDETRNAWQEAVVRSEAALATLAAAHDDAVIAREEKREADRQAQAGRVEWMGAMTNLKALMGHDRAKPRPKRQPSPLSRRAEAGRRS